MFPCSYSEAKHGKQKLGWNDLCPRCLRWVHFSLSSLYAMSSPCLQIISGSEDYKYYQSRPCLLLSHQEKRKTLELEIRKSIKNSFRELYFLLRVGAWAFIWWGGGTLSLLWDEKFAKLLPWWAPLTPDNKMFWAVQNEMATDICQYPCFLYLLSIIPFNPGTVPLYPLQPCPALNPPGISHLPSHLFLG